MGLINHFREMNSKYKNEKSIDEQINKLEIIYNDDEKTFINIFDDYKEYLIKGDKKNYKSHEQELEKLQRLNQESGNLIMDIFKSLLVESEHNIPDSKVWAKVTEVYYYNKTNLIKSSNIISVWIYKIITDDKRKETIEEVKKSNFEKSSKYQHYDHELMFLKIDCKNRQIKMENFIDYDDDGKVIDSDTYKDIGWISIVPETIMEELYNKLCVTPKKPLKKK
jgi:hypothetical protein